MFEKNWFGKTPHPSDELFHWQDNSRPTKQPEFEKLVAQLRADYDLLSDTKEKKAALQRLLDQQYHNGYENGVDSENPDL